MSGVTPAEATAEMSGWSRLRCARAELAASPGQTEEVALPRGWDGGRVVVLLSLLDLV